MSIFSNPILGAPGQAATYVRAVLDLLGDRNPLQVLGETPEQLDAVMGRIRPRDITTPEAPDKWSAIDVACHLADSELVWAYRLRMILAEDHPRLGGYDQDRWAERLRYREEDPADVVRDFGVVRRSNLRLLAGQPDEAFERVGVHAERGEESVRHLIRLYAGHDLVHLRQLERIQARFPATA